jgi:hypothetical protein
MSKEKVAIQKRIEEVLKEEFEKLILESSTDPLLKLVIEKDLERLSLEELKKLLNGGKIG